MASENGLLKGHKLRLISYLAPGIPLQLYQTYQYYLEEALGCDSVLMVESRGSGPLKDRPNPFDNDEVDIAFMCSSSFLKHVEEKNPYIELMEAAPIHIHPKSELRPIYYSDVIIHADRAESLKEFIDLKGHKWAYNDELSLSGNLTPLAQLRKMGFNASFFGHIIHSGCHFNSIELVLNQTVDAAAIDSNVLNGWLLAHPEYKDKLQVLCSWGPLPIQPVVFNSRLSDTVKKSITEALLNMNKDEKWNTELAKHHVWGFKPTDHSLYDKEKEIQGMVKNLSIYNAYY